jgi:hypothetical protein
MPRLVLCQCGMQPLPPCFDAHTVDHIDAHACNSNSKQHSAQHSVRSTAAEQTKPVYKGCILLPCIEEEYVFNTNNSSSNNSSSNSVSNGYSGNKRDIAAAEAAHKVYVYCVLYCVLEKFCVLIVLIAQLSMSVIIVVVSRNISDSL